MYSVYLRASDGLNLNKAIEFPDLENDREATPFWNMPMYMHETMKSHAGSAYLAICPCGLPPSHVGGSGR